MVCVVEISLDKHHDFFKQNCSCHYAWIDKNCILQDRMPSSQWKQRGPVQLCNRDKSLFQCCCKRHHSWLVSIGMVFIFSSKCFITEAVWGWKAFRYVFLTFPNDFPWKQGSLYFWQIDCADIAAHQFHTIPTHFHSQDKGVDVLYRVVRHPWKAWSYQVQNCSVAAK